MINVQSPTIEEVEIVICPADTVCIEMIIDCIVIRSKGIWYINSKITFNFYKTFDCIYATGITYRDKCNFKNTCIGVSM